MGNSLVSIQNSLSAGELSPSVWGRTDIQKYHSGTTTCRNFFANYRGGVSSRAGLAYVGMCKQQYPVPPRDIPFQFSVDQGYALEFGEHYMRVKSNGGYVLETTKTVVSVDIVGTVTTSAPHGYSVGDWVFGAFNSNIDGLAWIISSIPTSTSFIITDLFGNSVAFTNLVLGGTVARIYTVTSPYAAVDLPYLKYTQSADVMTLTCVNIDSNTEYPPYSLARLGNTNWTFTQDTFTAVIQPPTNILATAQGSSVASTWYQYVVTAIDRVTGEESVASAPAFVQNNDISVSSGSNTITWNAVANAVSYNIYAATPSYQATVPASSLYGFIGTSRGPSFTDTNIQADFTKVPPVHNDPFARNGITDITVTSAGTNYDQTTVSYVINTSTGTGFRGTPIIDNGAFAGFVIDNEGQNYSPSDTITINDSGGGRASGSFTFSANPADTNVVKFNGIQLNFSASVTFPTTAGYVYTHLENTLALTLQTLANTLNASNLLSLSVATYSSDATHLYVKYKTPGAVGNAYTLNAATAPCTASGATLTGGGTAGSGATGTLVLGKSSGTYPAVAAYFQQRRVYASSLNQPDTYWMTKPGLYHNMDSSVPVVASDAITGTPWAQQVNGIQFLVPMPGGLVVLTGRGAWQVNGGQSAAITPSNQTAIPQAYNGCNPHIPPHVINYDILYVQSKGSIWRDLSYNFFTNIYTGTDITTLSNHLFNDYSMVQSAYAEEPYKLVWAIRNDGILLCLTFLKEQDVYAWTRHDTNGFFVSVCSITEPPVDAIYLITQRYVQGGWRYYSERMDDRTWNNVEDTFCVDAGLRSPLNYPDATLSVSAKTGNVNISASASVFSSANAGDIIRTNGGKIEVVSYLSPTQLTGLVIEDLSLTIPNDPDETPIPTVSGDWSIATPISTVTHLNHLEGLEVTGLADGSVIPKQTVINGSISLVAPASNIVVGLPYTCQVQTVFLDVSAGAETIQNKRKNISAVGARVEMSRGLQVGADQKDSSAQQFYAPVTWSNMTEIKERTNQVNAGTAVPLYTGDFYQALTSGWNLKGQLAFQQIYPLPANILSAVFYCQVGDDK